MKRQNLMGYLKARVNFQPIKMPRFRINVEFL